MNAIIDVALSPVDDAKVTPCELLEDFADVTAGWWFLDEDSVHYTQVQERPACILRHASLKDNLYADFGFVASGPGHQSTVHLRLIDPLHPHQAFERSKSHELLSTLVEALDRYVATHRGLVELTVRRRALQTA